MEQHPTQPVDGIDRRIADRLKALRAERGWSLEALAQRSGISKASLSRLENAEVSPTAAVLGRLCAAYGLTMSRLMALVEEHFPPVVRQRDRQAWTDPETGFRRTGLSPPAPGLDGEVLDCTLLPGTRLAYDGPPRPGLEHHLLLVDGALEVTVDGTAHALGPGDCLRYRLYGESLFVTPPETGARYFLFLV